MKIKKIIPLAAVLLSMFSMNAQVVKFEVVIGGSGYDYGYSVAQTYDKGYIVAGATSSFGNGSMDAYMVKVDSNGVPQLHRTYGGINIEQAYSIKETSDSGMVIAGYTNSFGHGGYDMYLIKTNIYGDTVWTKTYGGTNWDFGYSAQQTTDGGYILAGSTYSFGNGNSDMYLIKTNATGDTTWTKTFGGSNDDEARCVKQTSDGGYILTGWTKSFGDASGDIYTVKTDSNGDTLWTYRYPGTQEDASYDVVEYPTKYLIGGKSKSVVPGNMQGVALEISLTGAFQYIGDYGGAAEDGTNAVAYSPGGRFAVMGYTYSFGGGLGTSDYLLYIENPVTGLHSGTYGASKMEQAYSIQNTTDGGYIICGNSSSYSILDHIYIIKTDSNGVSSGTVINVVAGINSVSAAGKNFKIYPNPAADLITIELEDAEENVISIRDLPGKEIYREKAMNEKTEINTSAFANGVYFISIESKGSVSVKRLIIQH
ncbi:MAG: hypothetical protein JWO09_268 [Bacteroidetes bacterium]|nr:hypothetical protein [Bacteroidota bacterium]